MDNAQSSNIPKACGLRWKPGELTFDLFLSPHQYRSNVMTGCRECRKGTFHNNRGGIISPHCVNRDGYVSFVGNQGSGQ